jgi:predicted transposase YdaD
MAGNVHDALFKATFSQVEHAIGLLRQALPAALVARIDFETLELRPGSFVDEDLKERHTDLLFTVAIDGKRALVYVLLEHQSSDDALMPFRMLRYMVRIWEDYLREHPDAKRLPAIVPLVLHHSEAGWAKPTALEQLFDLDPETLAAMGEHVPRLRFILDDISAETDEALRGRAMTALGRLALLCLRRSRTPEDLVRSLGSWVDLVRDVRRSPNGASALATIWRYVFMVSERLGQAEILPFLVAAAGEEEERGSRASLGERLIEEGRVKGLEQGREQGREEGLEQGREEARRRERELLAKLLMGRFGPLPEAAVARLNVADSAQIDRWIERFLTASSLADVLGDG